MGTRTRGLANNILTGGTIDATDGLSGAIPSSNINNNSVSAVTSMPASVGDFIQSVASDPSPATVGDVWYNNATYAFKLASVTTAGTWASGGNMNTARYFPAGAGTQTAVLAFGGQPGSGRTGATESYNGTSWTISPFSLNTAVSHAAGFGTQTAAINTGGINNALSNVTTTESWNGTSWTTNPTGLGTAKELMGSAGTQTAGIIYGGYLRAPNTRTNATELWNGSSFSSSPGTLNTARYGGMSAGIQTAALYSGGDSGPPPKATNSESWNGTVWTTTPTINTGRDGGGSSGTQTLALIFGGDPAAPTGATELWNGTSWTTNPNSLTTARAGFARGITGTQTAGLAFGAESVATEEFTGPGVATTQTITTS
jgi:hypothetical protein